MLKDFVFITISLGTLLSWLIQLLLLFSCLAVSDSFCDPMDCSPPGFSVHADSPGRNTEVGCCFLLQGIFPTHGSNPHLLSWQVDSLPVSHQGSLANIVDAPYSRILSLWILLLAEIYLLSPNLYAKIVLLAVSSVVRNQHHTSDKIFLNRITYKTRSVD